MTPARERRAIALLATAAFVSAAAIRLCDPMLPALAREFGTTTGEAAQAVTAYAIAYGVLGFFFGPLGDHHGKFRVIAAATLACSVGSAGAATASSLAWLVFWRFLSGASGAGIIALAIAWIGDAIPYDRRQATIARFLTGSILGMAGGQLIGGVFTDYLGWRGAFVFLACSYLLVGGLLQLERRRVLASEPLDPPATGGARPRLWPQVRGVVEIGWARVIIAIVCLEALLFFGPIAFIPAYLHLHVGVSLAAAGAIAAAYALGGLCYTLLAKRLIARLGERGLARGGGLLMGVSFAVVLIAPAWGWSLASTFALGLGFYMLHNTLQTNASQMAPHARGTAVSLFAAAMYLAQSAGIVIASLVFDRASAAWLFLTAGAALALLGTVFARLLKARPEPGGT